MNVTETRPDRWASNASSSASAATVDPQPLPRGGDALLWVPVAICLLMCLFAALVGGGDPRTEPAEGSHCLIRPLGAGLPC